jgi:hypothetical protein
MQGSPGEEKANDVIGETGNASVVLLDSAESAGCLFARCVMPRLTCHKALYLLMIGVLLGAASGGLHA